MGGFGAQNGQGEGTARVRAIGYVRVSSKQQESEGMSLQAQQAKLAGFCDREGLELIGFRTEVKSGKDLKRPVLQQLLGDLDLGEADVLICVRLDRLSRSVGDFAGMLDRAKKKGWKLIVMDPMVDMTTPFGECMANVAMAFAQLERHLISARTKEGMAIAIANGYDPRDKPTTFRDRAVIDHIVAMYRSGMGKKRIVTQLAREGILSPAGNELWNTRAIRDVLVREGVYVENRPWTHAEVREPKEATQ